MSKKGGSGLIVESMHVLHSSGKDDGEPTKYSEHLTSWLRKVWFSKVR